MALGVSACGGQDEPGRTGNERGATVQAESRVIATRWYSEDQVRRGAAVFEQNCAVCHGAGAEGADNWQYRGPDGKFPPPPLNGTAHAWHHPLAQLFHMVKNGTQPAGNMPAWGGTLSDEEMIAAIAWFQSLWPDEVYQAWFEMEMRVRAQDNRGVSK
ncbi:MAG TPA: cytochrome c [Thioalkalivibrio sp.]|nr:cytochrome c [Thioalkalivibrio sp.]